MRPDRGREASYALTEVRTVLSRALTALVRTGGPRETYRLPKPASPAGIADMGEPPSDDSRPSGYDPDITLMRAALEQVVGLLWPWRKTGTTKTWCTPVAEPPPLDLAAIRERYARVADMADSELTGTTLAFAAALAGTLSAADVPDLLAEVDRLGALLEQGAGGQAAS